MLAVVNQPELWLLASNGWNSASSSPIFWLRASHTLALTLDLSLRKSVHLAERECYSVEEKVVFFFFFPTELEFCGLSKQNVLTNETKRSAQMAEGNQGRIHFGLSKEWGISGHQVSLAVSWNLPPDPFLSLSPNVDTPLVNVNIELRSSLNSTIILYTSPFTCLTQHSHISCRHQVTRFKNSFTWDSDL